MKTAFLTLLLVLLPLSVAQACYCSKNEELSKKNIAEAEIIIKATPVSTEITDKIIANVRYAKASFKVDQYYKGQGSEVLEVYYTDATSCDVEVAPEKSSIFFVDVLGEERILRRFCQSQFRPEDLPTFESK